MGLLNKESLFGIAKDELRSITMYSQPDLPLYKRNWALSLEIQGVCRNYIPFDPLAFCPLGDQGVGLVSSTTQAEFLQGFLYTYDISQPMGFLGNIRYEAQLATSEKISQKEREMTE
jgi:hypothetical protein